MKVKAIKRVLELLYNSGIANGLDMAHSPRDRFFGNREQWDKFHKSKQDRAYREIRKLIAPHPKKEEVGK